MKHLHRYWCMLESKQYILQNPLHLSWLLPSPLPVQADKEYPEYYALIHS